MTTAPTEVGEEAPPRVNVRVLSLSHIQLSESDDSAGDEAGASEKESCDSDLEEAKPQQQLFKKQKLLCPITRLPMVNPVVHPKDGLSYEKEALVAREKARDYYSNRALLEYMKPELNPRNELQSHIQDKIGIFFCPITEDLMRDPVIDPGGSNYERAAIVDWIEQHGVSPITQKPLRASQLHDNTALFRLLYNEIRRADDDIANSDEIQAWKRDVSSFNYLTNAIQPGAGSCRYLEMESSCASHPARMRVDYNGRWRSRNRDTVMVFGLVLVGLLFGIFLFIAFPEIAGWLVGAFAVVVLGLAIFRWGSKDREEDED